MTFWSNNVQQTGQMAFDVLVKTTLGELVK
jgi:hypothetical protein